ncbi:conjugative transfer ATPase [Pokkaliibacter sp. MBI-7]|uniref:conjugative transfer ATPase n=2 Tax=Pokkaliibacter sp. MBI-7 TaxID=3040600 RepID=UPI00244944A6|nr:conjugative transfer ATPase [Pokkaliibacter sp. MBI-7]MDH2436668.1 conjugative transfer ATPase [Pokkaliibacter sp. MBI-7]
MEKLRSAFALQGDGKHVVSLADGSTHERISRSNMTIADEQAFMNKGQEFSSFVDLLPWVDYNHKHQVFELEDGSSVGVVFELKPVITEGRDDAFIENVRFQVQQVLQSSFDEYDTEPWVVQLYCQDETSFSSYLEHLDAYIDPMIADTEFTQAYLKQMEGHLRGISKPGGLFEDTAVTRNPWRGQIRRTRLVLYRRFEANFSLKGHSTEDEFETAVQDINDTCARLVANLESIGIDVQRCDGRSVFQWLLPWFNPCPTLTQGDTEALGRLAHYVDEEPPEGRSPLLDDFSECLMYSHPASDVNRGVWLFDRMPHRVIMMNRFKQVPRPGILTAELRRGRMVNSLFDSLPESTIMTMTMVITPQDSIEAHIDKIRDSSSGHSNDATAARKECDVAQRKLLAGDKMCRFSLAFYVRGQDMAQLNERTNQIIAVTQTAGIEMVDPRHEVAPLNSYLRWLPMNYKPHEDRKHWYVNLAYFDHLASIVPIFGRAVGTGNPGFTAFNRGGGPLTFDMLSTADRAKNAHMLLLGPTGAGKSATLVAMLTQVLAIHRPRVFLIEAGNSFGLFADYCQSLGLSVNKVSLKPGSGVRLNPFADSHLLFESGRSYDPDDISDDEADDSDDDEGDAQRDVLGEMEVAARLMITGGEEAEIKEYKRQDRSAVRRAIQQAAEEAYAGKRQMTAPDLQRAMRAMARDPDQSETRRLRIEGMADALDLMCAPGSFEEEMFAKEGTPWPEVDVTVVDLATLSREGYEGQLSLALISLFNHINNIAERDQFSGRQIVVPIDEAHIVTVNSLLAPYVAKIGKMWRKLGAWLWLATQNMDDFPDFAKKLLGLCEWWILLVMEPAEVEQVARFKTLSADQKHLVLSAQKEKHKYTEGVVLSKNLQMLFRSVPPSLYLALGMTEKEEKKARKGLMDEHGVSELEAALMIAQKLDKARGLGVSSSAGISSELCQHLNPDGIYSPKKPAWYPHPY